MLERFGAVSIILGTIVGMIAFWWLVERVVRVFLSRKPWSTLKRPAILLFVSVLLTGLPLAVNFAMTHLSSLGPLDKMVSGERHLTLTGWDQKDYSVIATRPDTILLQMANPDVTDETLQYLSGLTQLRELDLNNSQVTDKGLETISDLPNLRDLRVARTKITDEGFRQHLFEKKTLVNLELTGTSVASKTIREWKAADPDRKALK